MIAQADIRALPLADNSVDMIFTDPPYARKTLYTYEWLATEAARVLKPGGFVLAMCGGNYQGPIHRWFMNAGLECFFDIAVIMENGRASAYLWHIGVNVRAKFIIAYSKGKGKLRVQGMQNMYTGRRDKRFHEWGQDVDHARYFIDHMSKPGDLVLDPFIGGGTTAEACELLGRRHLSFDINPIALATTQARVNEMRRAIAAQPWQVGMFATLPA